LEIANEFQALQVSLSIYLCPPQLFWRFSRFSRWLWACLFSQAFLDSFWRLSCTHWE